MSEKKRILVVIGHPSKQSFSKLIGESYFKGAKEAGIEVKIVYLSGMKFNPSLENGYRKNQKLEKDLVEFQKYLLWAEHLVFVYPIWWGGAPAKFSGLIERTFLPGFAFKFRKRGILPEQLFRGKSARIFLVKGSSRIFYFGSFAFPGMIMRRFILNLTGVFPVRINSFYHMTRVSERKKERILSKVLNMGKKGK